jgi:hypothetical protein
MCCNLQKSTRTKACSFYSSELMSEPAMFDPSVSIFMLDGDVEVECHTTQNNTHILGYRSVDSVSSYQCSVQNFKGFGTCFSGSDRRTETNPSKGPRNRTMLFCCSKVYSHRMMSVWFYLTVDVLIWTRSREDMKEPVLKLVQVFNITVTLGRIFVRFQKDVQKCDVSLWIVLLYHSALQNTRLGTTCLPESIQFTQMAPSKDNVISRFIAYLQNQLKTWHISMAFSAALTTASSITDLDQRQRIYEKVLSLHPCAQFPGL